MGTNSEQGESFAKMKMVSAQCAVSKLVCSFVILLVKAYQLLVSPLLGPRCRFEPSCSHYFIESLNGFGLIKGAALGVKRILKCHPWHSGGYDPVPRSHKHEIRK